MNLGPKDMKFRQVGSKLLLRGKESDSERENGRVRDVEYEREELKKVIEREREGKKRERMRERKSERETESLGDRKSTRLNSSH